MDTKANPKRILKKKMINNLFLLLINSPVK